MSKLEPGCKAIVIGGRCNENYGKLVNVGNFVGSPPVPEDGILFFYDDYWEVDREIVFTDSKGSKETFFLASGKTLQRINDHEKRTTESEKKLTIKV